MDFAVNKEEANLTTNSKTTVRGTLQIVPIRVHRKTGSHEDTKVFCDTGSSRTWIDQELLETIIPGGGGVTIHVAAFHGAYTFQSMDVMVTLGWHLALPLTRVL